MALVAYDYSSDSDENEDDSQKTEKIEEINDKSKLLTNGNIGNGTSEISDEEEDMMPPTPITGTNMFDKLPPKKEISQEVYEDKVEDFIPKAEIPIKKAKVKITIPSLTDFQDLDDEEPTAKKPKPSSKGSGLLSLLPPVKCIPMSNKSFVPNVLIKPKTATKVTEPLIPQSVIKNKKTVKPTSKPLKDTESDDSDGDVELPETFDEELWKKSCAKTLKINIIKDEPAVEIEPIEINCAPEAIKPYEGLDNTAFKELVGNSKRMPRNIKLIDVNEEALVAENELWMTKSLTDPNYIPKKTEEDDEDGIDPTKRKKHHITYLAQQAKANEQELQNQWSASKFSRNQTRAKYGF